MTPLIAFLAVLAADLQLEPCVGSDETKDHLHFARLSLLPERVLPGERLCVQFEAAPDKAIRRGMRLRLDIPGVQDNAGEYELCSAVGIACPSVGNVSGTICDSVPLAAMLLAGKQVPFALRAVDEAGAPMACVRSMAMLAATAAIDADVEAHVDAAVHRPLRRALFTVEDARSGTATVAEHAEGIRRLLLEAYEAAPEWADAYARWRAAHGKQRRLDQSDQPPEDVLAEARGFSQFRQNVLATVRSGRSLALDERSDMRQDHIRTLGHFA